MPEAVVKNYKDLKWDKILHDLGAGCHALAAPVRGQNPASSHRQSMGLTSQEQLAHNVAVAWLFVRLNAADLLGKLPCTPLRPMDNVMAAVYPQPYRPPRFGRDSDGWGVVERLIPCGPDQRVNSDGPVAGFGRVNAREAVSD